MGCLELFKTIYEMFLEVVDKIEVVGVGCSYRNNR